MQRNISNKVFLGQNVSPFDNAGESDAIDRTASNYNDAKEKVQKVRELITTGNYDADIANTFLVFSKWNSKECLRISTRGKK